MAGKAEIAKAYVSIIPSMKDSQKTIKDELGGAADSASKSVGKSSGSILGESIMGSLKGVVSAAAVATALVEVGKYLTEVGKEFDAALDSIVIGTGASGSALRGLAGDAKTVAREIPVSFGDASQAIADLNTRMGLSGESAVTLAEQILEAGRLMGQSLDINSITGAFNAWGLSADEASAAMDSLFSISQATGKGIGDMASLAGTYSAEMQILGFSFEETAALIGNLDKYGINASASLKTLSNKLTSLAKDGEEPREALHRLTDEVKRLYDAGDTESALDLLGEYFGSGAGSKKLLNAITTGAMSIDDLADAMDNSQGSIMRTAAMTNDFDEALQRTTNSFKEMLEPIADPLFQGLSMVMEGVAASAEIDARKVQFLSDALGELFDNRVAKVREQYMPVMQAWSDVLQNSVMPAIDSLKEAWLTFVDAWANGFGGLRDSDVGGLIGNLDDTVNGFASGSLVQLVTGLGNGLTSAINAATTALTTLSNIASSAQSAINSFFETVKSWFSANFGIPNIKLPHPTISPAGWTVGDLLKGVIPSIGINWYAKGGIVDGATLIGAGEAGPEAIVPLQGRYMRPFAQEVADNMGGGGTTVYIDGAIVNQDEAIESAFVSFMSEIARVKRMGVA